MKNEGRHSQQFFCHVDSEITQSREKLSLHVPSVCSEFVAQNQTLIYPFSCSREPHVWPEKCVGNRKGSVSIFLCQNTPVYQPKTTLENPPSHLVKTRIQMLVMKFSSELHVHTNLGPSRHPLPPLAPPNH